MNKQMKTPQLLDHEPRAEEQVPLLITLHEDELALVKAIDSGDTDLSMLRFLLPADVVPLLPSGPSHRLCMQKSRLVIEVISCQSVVLLFLRPKFLHRSHSPALCGRLAAQDFCSRAYSSHVGPFLAVYMAVLHLKRKLPLGDFLHIIHNKPVACNLLVQWCKVRTRVRSFFSEAALARATLCSASA